MSCSGYHSIETTSKSNINGNLNFWKAACIMMSYFIVTALDSKCLAHSWFGKRINKCGFWAKLKDFRNVINLIYSTFLVHKSRRISVNFTSFLWSLLWNRTLKPNIDEVDNNSWNRLNKTHTNDRIRRICCNQLTFCYLNSRS